MNDIRIVGVTLDPNSERWQKFSWWLAVVGLPEPIPFIGVDGSIPETYKNLAVTGQAEGWDHRTTVAQDDVRFARHPKPKLNKRVEVYGRYTSPEHVCPWAFSANPEGWEQLKTLWIGEIAGEDNSGLICRQWYPALREPYHSLVAHL